ncbi:putative dehydrogenase [Kaistia geumhonensis]|uniref:Dehydrogenase n=2 Tax=Kaistia geumhonensis TaxID=410839 RepID=A0ABU0M5F2_9HYPH|nr:putative dehydrogenase [Kaistia geumhonensis]
MRLRVGIVGCGNIAETYLRNARMFPGVELTACADLVPEAATRRADTYGLRALAVDELIRSDEVDLVLNLTIPAAHFDISSAALAAGKHVFTEKPLSVSFDEGRRLVDMAEAHGLALGCAPDTFLGAAGRMARRLMDEGAIGRVVTGTAFMMSRGMEHWHPNPQFYYQPGAGPVLDMGPYYLTMLATLLGPARRVTAIATTGEAERLITAPGPTSGTRFSVGTPTTVHAALEFASGAVVAVGMSWDVFRHGNHPIELHGTEGSLRLPDPDTFGGTVALSERGGDWREMPTDQLLNGRHNWPFDKPDRANYRMLGVADLAASLAGKRASRASGKLALHVLEIMEAILLSAAEGKPRPLTTTIDRPPALSEAEAAALQAA